MTDEEYYDYCKTGFSFFTSFILFPAVSLILMVFGYTKISIIIIEMVVLCLSIVSFLRRLWFLRKHRRYITNKQFYFQNLSYVICLLISIIAAFFVKLTVEDGKNVLNGFFLNIYIIPIVIIYEFVVLGFMAKTAKDIAKLIKPKQEEIFSRDIEQNE
jgi:hypothetical protein